MALRVKKIIFGNTLFKKPPFSNVKLHDQLNLLQHNTLGHL